VPHPVPQWSAPERTGESTSPDPVGVGVGAITTHRSGGEIEAEVLLTWGDVHADGRASGPSTLFERPRVVGRATLDALGKLFDADPGLSLGEIEERSLGARRVVLACVLRLREGREEGFVGTAEVGSDPEQAVIRAVLDAVRPLWGTLRPRPPVEYVIGPAPTG